MFRHLQDSSSGVSQQQRLTPSIPLNSEVLNYSQLPHKIHVYSCSSLLFELLYFVTHRCCSHVLSAPENIKVSIKKKGIKLGKGYTNQRQNYKKNEAKGRTKNEKKN